MNQQFIAKIINNAFGIGTHEPSSIESKDDFTRYGTCKHCLNRISSFWIDDEDRGQGWSEWKGEKSCLIPPK